MDENTRTTTVEFAGAIAIPASRNTSRQDTEPRPSSARLHEKAGGSVLARAASTGGNSMGRLLSVEEVASLLKVPRKWVYRRVGLRPPDGLPYLKVGKYLRFRENDLRDYVERLRRN
jgi:excisionase family DNA binding protein